jgi:hypothetical protein
MARRKIIIKQRNANDNLSAIIKNLTTFLDIDVSFSAIDLAINNHPSFPEIADPNDILKEWGIHAELIKTNIDGLGESIFPVIAQMRTYNYYYVLVLSIDSKSITYIDTKKGLVKENLYIFEQNWTGIIGLITSNPDSGEEDYKKSRKNEKVKNIKFKSLQYLLLTIIILIIFAGLQFHVSLLQWLPFFLLQATGAYLSTFLLLAEYDNFNLLDRPLFLPNQILEKLRVEKNNFDHRILGTFYSKECLSLYFVGGLFYLFLSTFTNQLISSLFILSILNVIFIPFVIYNYYISKNKKYPTLYAILNFILFIEFPFVGFNISNTIHLDYLLGATFFMCFCIPPAIWILLKPKLKMMNELVQDNENLKIFKNPLVRRQLFDSSPLIQTNRAKYEIYCGDFNANLQITIFISPIDLRSGYFFLLLRGIVKEYTNVKLITKFIISNNYLSNNVTRHVISYFTTHTPEDTSFLIEHWFLDPTKDLNTFKENFNTQEMNQDVVNQIMKEHERDTQKVNNFQLPAMLINNRLVPEYFDSNDIEFLIKNDPLREQSFALTEKEKFWKDKRPSYLNN